jgi:hypothetical protein
MYNKLFSKIVTSSIWLEPTPTRMIWITFLALMDEDGFAPVASVANLAHTARIDLEDATKAVQILESPDENSGDKDNDGRRIERVPGGWMVLNAKKYRDIVTRTVAREKTRERVRRHRERKTCNADVTPANVHVTQSEAYTEADTEAKTQKVPTEPVPQGGTVSDNFEFVGKVPATIPETKLAIVRVFDHWRTVHRHERAKLDDKRKRLIASALKNYSEADLCQAISGYCNSPHHMGQNDKNVVYDDIELLLRDAKHSDAGLKFYADPPRTDLSEKTRRIISQTEGWRPAEYAGK